MERHLLLSGCPGNGLELADIISFLASIRITGALRIGLGTKNRLTLFLEDGFVAGCTSPWTNHSHEEFLVGKDLVGSAAFEQARAANGIDENLVESLVEAGHLSRNQFDAMMIDDYVDCVSRVIKKRHVDFQFFQGVERPWSILGVKIEVQRLLMDSVLSLDEWDRLPSQFKIESTAFELVSDPKSAEISFSLVEWKLLFLLQGGHRLGELWKKSPLDSRLATSKALYGFASARLIRPAMTPIKSEAPSDSGMEESTPEIGVASSAVLESATHALKLGIEKKKSMTGARTVPLKLTMNRGAKFLNRSSIVVKTRGFLEEIRTDEIAPKTIEITANVFKIGRSSKVNQLVLPSTFVSRQHARIIRDGHDFAVESTTATNELFVNGEQVERVYLRRGDELLVYPFKFRFELDSEVTELALEPESDG